MLAASVIVVTETHLGKTDAALLGATTLAMGLLARAYRQPRPLGVGQAALFWLAIGAGILLKGPITPMVVALTAVPLSLWDRRWRWLGRLRPGWGVPLMVLAVLPWFVAIGLATHGAFFQDAVGGDSGEQDRQRRRRARGSAGLHLLLLPLLAFPASFAVLFAFPAAWRARAEPATRFLIAWVVPSWLVFEAVPTKLPHYPLPLYPAVLLLAAWSVLTLGPAGWWGRVVRFVPLVIAAALGCAAVALPVVLGESPWLGAPVVVAAVLTGWLASRPGGQVTALAAVPLFTLALVGWELPQAAPLWIAPRAEAAVVAAGLSGRTIGSVGFHEPSLMFLAGTDTVMEPTAQSGAAALATGQVAGLLVGDRDEAAFHAEAARLGLVPQAVAAVSGFNYSRGRRTTLTLYRR
ncbi:MAG: glycosyl transferase [Acetobacteraceae bacterium]